MANERIISPIEVNTINFAIEKIDEIRENIDCENQELRTKDDLVTSILDISEVLTMISENLKSTFIENGKKPSSEFEELSNVIRKYNAIIKKCSTYDEPTKEEVDLVCGVDFEIAKSLVMHYPDIAVKVAKMILAHKGEDVIGKESILL